MRILGIDPGLRVTGFGVIDVSGHQLAYVASGVIKTPTADLPTRLGTIYDGVSTLIREHTPDQAAIEKVFVNVNPQSTLLLGQARGAAICGLVSGGLPVAEYTALQLKQAVVGYGRATKEQMQEMVARLLSLSGRPGTDAADALGMAICHAHGGNTLNTLGGIAPALAKRGCACGAGGSSGNARRTPTRAHRGALHSRFPFRPALAMIGRIAGTLLEKNPPHILVDCNGVGYEVDVPMSTFYNLPHTGEKVVLLTQLIVREDAHLLYGFLTPPERSTFRELLKITGVGARMALAVLSGMSVAELSQAVTLQDAARLTRVPGIGKKTAERLLLELKGKLGADLGPLAGAASPSDHATDILNALVALGYSEKEALAAIKNVPAGTGVSEGIKLSLKALSKA